MTQKEMEIYDMMVELEVATAEELNLVRNVLDGSWEQILLKVLYARTGNASWEAFLMEIAEEE